MVLRALAIVVALMFGGQATGLLEAVVDECAGPCGADEGEGACPPACSACPCAPRLVAATACTMELAPLGARLVRAPRVIECSGTSAADGHTRGLQHVPILA
ncbi:MAG: hypothetical protein IT383_07430 [Deltaproteobacteria bacterium]|nr:hypothetical protein [Deltaproteobacteria bacterium]